MDGISYPALGRGGWYNRGRMWARGVIWGFLLAAVAAPLAGQPAAASRAVGAAVPGPGCEDGLVQDDGSAESGYGWVPSVTEGVYVQELAGALASPVLESVCVCWLRTGADDALDFEIVVYEGIEVVDPRTGRVRTIPAAEPYAAVAASAAGVPEDVPGAFYEIPLGGLRLRHRTAYVGVRWNASTDRFFFVCTDQSPGTPPVEVFFRDDRAFGWASVFDTSDPIFRDHRAILLRVRAMPPLDLPALDAAGLGILGIGLAAAALWRLGRRRKGSPGR